MLTPVRLLLLLCLPLSTAAQLNQPAPLASGYITALDPSGAFDVEGLHIRLAPATRFETRQDTRTVTISKPAFYLGETVDIYGRLEKKTNSIDAGSVVLIPPVQARFHGTAIVDLVPATTSTSGRTLRADGYLLRITPGTALTFTPPLTSASALGTNLWIDYHGVQQIDGTVLLDRAELTANAVNRGEDKIRKKAEYDPAAVDPDARQGGVNRFFLGVNLHMLPPWQDAAMQTRVQRIGDSLVPAFQRALPDSDPTKIHFRFAVIDSTHWRDAVTLPNGIIVVPHQVVDRLQNDSQLATVLADNIASALEKDTFRAIPAGQKMTAAQIAGEAGGFFIPGLGIATWAANKRIAAHLESVALQQSGRVSLCLLHDAGYDLTQAPLTWWLLAPRNPQPVDHTPMPPRAANLYMALGTTWRPAP